MFFKNCLLWNVLTIHNKKRELKTKSGFKKRELKTKTIYEFRCDQKWAHTMCQKKDFFLKNQLSRLTCDICHHGLRKETKWRWTGPFTRVSTQSPWYLFPLTSVWVGRSIKGSEYCSMRVFCACAPVSPPFTIFAPVSPPFSIGLCACFPSLYNLYLRQRGEFWSRGRVSRANDTHNSRPDMQPGRPHAVWTL